MKYKILTIFILTAILKSQVVIETLYRDPVDVFKISDWKTYLSFQRITDVTESQQHVFFATDGAGLLRYDKFSNRFDFPLTKSNGLISNKIYAIRELAQDTSLNYAQYAVLYIRTEFGEKRQIIDLTQNDNAYFRDDFNFNVTEVDYFKTKQALEFSETYNLEHPYSMSAGPEVIDENFEVYKEVYKYQDKNNGSWLFVTGLGLFRSNFESGTYKFYRSGPSSNACIDLFLYENSVYIGHAAPKNNRSTVLSVWNTDNNWEHFKAKHIFGFSGSRINRIKALNDTILLASDQGLISFSARNKTFTVKKNSQLQSLEINDFTLSEDTYLLASSSGLYHYYPNSGLISEIVDRNFRNKKIRRIAGNTDEFFFTTKYEIFHYKLDSLRYFRKEMKKAITLSNNSFVEYNDNKFWFNNSSGIFYYNPKNKETKSIRLSSSSFRIKINKVISHKDYIFLGTSKGIIIYYADSDKWIWLNERDGLPHSNIRDLILDGEYLLILYPNGISEFKWRISI